MNTNNQQKENKTYRVFTTRHYIAVQWFDIIAQTPKRARNLAEKAANHLIPDARQIATDNQWHSDEPTPIERIGQFSDNGTHEMMPIELPKMNKGEQVLKPKG